MAAQIEIQPVARATTPTIAPTTETARMASSARRSPGVFTFRGRMVDEPLIRHAERLVRRLFPVSIQQGRFAADLVLGHGRGTRYLVSVSSISGEVACTCTPSMG